jgi:hypothetical protein
VAVYAVWGDATGLAGLAGLGGGVVLLVALLSAWDAGLSLAPILLLLAYALSVGDDSAAVDWRAPLVAVGLLGVVEFGSWSLELRDGAEERPLARLPFVLLLFGGALAASALVLGIGGIRPDAGLALWALGAAAAIGLLALIASERSSPQR